MPAVSVLVPSYNHARFIGKCIDSVLAQTFEDWEMVVVDDGSTDETVEIARSYKDPRIKVHVNQTNLGTYGNQNRCLDLATGDLAAVLNSDDYWRPTKLEKQVALLKAHPECPLSYTRGLQTNPKGEEVRVEEAWSGLPTAEVHDLKPWMMADNRVLASSLVFRRAFARFESSLRYSGDWVVVLKLIQRGPAAFVNEELMVWRIHDENAHLHHVRHFSEEMRVREAILRNPDRWKVSDSDRPQLIQNLVASAFSLHSLYILVGEKQRATELMKWVLSVDPENGQAQKRSKLSWLPLGIQRSRLSPGMNPAEYIKAYEKADKTALVIDP